MGKDISDCMRIEENEVHAKEKCHRVGWWENKTEQAKQSN